MTRFHRWRDRCLEAAKARFRLRPEKRKPTVYRLQLESLEQRQLLSVTPQLLDDINAGAGGSFPTDFVNIGATTYFSANNGTNGYELWKTDGTSMGTQLVADINQGQNTLAGVAASSNPTNLTNVNGTLYFTATETNSYGNAITGLWKSDGTSEGTQLVADINHGKYQSYSSNPKYLTNVNGTLFFVATNTPSNQAANFEVWESDGTSSGTKMVTDPADSIQNLMNVGGKLYFTANGGNQLWVTDGTITTPIAVPADFDNVFQDMTDADGTLYFLGATQSNGSGIFKINGTSAEQVTTGISVGPLTNIGGELFFSGIGASYGAELYKSDGTSAGTVMVKDINPSGHNGVPYSSNPTNLTNVGGTLYFIANDRTDGYALWRSDGTSGGTTLVSKAPGNNVSDFTDVGGTLYFINAASGAQYGKLWRSDGTSSGTYAVTDALGGPSILMNVAGPHLTNASGSLFFAAKDAPPLDNIGIEPWILSASASSTAPGMPTGLNVTGTTQHSISLAWDSVSGATGYTLQRATSASGPWTVVYSGATPQFTDTDPTLTAGTTFFYRVAATNGSGASSFTAPISTSLGPPLGATIQNSTLTTVVGQGGATQVFVLGNDGQVWTQIVNNGQVLYALTQPGRVQQISASVDSGGRTNVFALGMDDQVWYETMTAANTWSPWTLTQAGTAVQIAAPASVSSSGLLQVFILGADDQVWTETRGNSTWSAWTLTQAGTVQQISALVDGKGNLNVYALGSDSQVWSETSTGNNVWSGWSLTQAGGALQVTAAISADSGTTSGLPEVFIIGGDGQIWSETRVAPGGWTAWTLTQPGGARAASAIRNSAGLPTVYIVGLDQQVWSETFNKTTGQWGPWSLTTPGKVQ